MMHLPMQFQLVNAGINYILWSALLTEAGSSYQYIAKPKITFIWFNNILAILIITNKFSNISKYVDVTANNICYCKIMLGRVMSYTACHMYKHHTVAI